MKISNYYIVDVNDFTEEELLNEDTLISKVMLLEKAKNSEEIEYFLKKIIPKIKNKDKDKEVINRIISIILSAKLDKNKIDELIKELKGDDEKMLAVMEMLEKENQMYINIGKKERKKRTEGKSGRKATISALVKNMLKENLSIELISKITGKTKEEIEKIKSE